MTKRKKILLIVLIVYLGVFFSLAYARVISSRTFGSYSGAAVVGFLIGGSWTPSRSRWF